MKVEYLKDINKLVVSSNELTLFLNGTNTFKKVNFIFSTCTKEVKTIFIPDTIVPSASEYVDSTDNKVKVSPEQLGIQDFEDGIWECKIEYIKTDTVCGSESSLTFKDSNLKCDVIKKISDDSLNEVGILYYFLQQADNCTCKKKELCNMLKKLKSDLGDGCE